MALVPAVHGSTRTWTGGYFSGLWSAHANWDTGAPQPGDDLVFPAGAAHLENTNNLGGYTLGSITISGSGYVLRGMGAGATIGLTGGLVASYGSGSSRVELNVRLEAAQMFERSSSLGSFYLSGDVDLNNNVLTVYSAGSFYLGGAIAGSRDLLKVGTGTVQLHGDTANTVTGTVHVRAGTLELNKNGVDALGGNLVIGDNIGSDTVRLLRNSQMPGTTEVTVNVSSLLDLDNHAQTVAGLTLNGGRVATGLGVLTLGGDVIAQAGSGPVLARISGVLSLGSGLHTFHCDWNGYSPALSVDARMMGAGGLKLTGNAGMHLAGSNTYAGLTIVAEHLLGIEHDHALGAISAGTIVSNGASLLLDRDGLSIAGEQLTLHGPGLSGSQGALWSANGHSCTWEGNVILMGDTEIGVVGPGGELWLRGVINGNAGFAKTKTGTLYLAGDFGNTHTGPTRLDEGTLVLAKTVPDGAVRYGELIVGDGLGGDNADVVRYGGPHQVHSSVGIRVNSSGRLDLDAFNDTVGDITLYGGTVGTTTGTLTLAGDVVVGNNPAGQSILEGSVALSGVRTFDVASTPFFPDLRVDAAIGGPGGLLKTGGGSLGLYQHNAFAGAATLNGGSVHVFQSGSLGGSAGGTTVNPDASLALAGTVHVASEPLTLNGAGIAETGALDSDNTSNSWSGPITLAGDSWVTIASGGTLNLAGPIDGPAGLTKAGAGTLVFSGSDTNSFAGDTWILQGTLALDKTGVDRAFSGPGTLFIGDDRGGLNADVVRLLRGTQIHVTTGIRVNESGLLDLNNHDDALGDLTLFGGRITTGTGTLITAGTLTSVASENYIADIDGHLELAGSLRNVVVADSAFWPDMRIDAAIIGTGGLRKNGPGSLHLSASNSYAGLTLVAQGDVTVLNSHALGQAGSGTVVSNGASLVLINNIHVPEEPASLTGAGRGGTWGALYVFQGSNSWAGNIALEGDAVVRVNAPEHLTLSGILGGHGGLTKTSDGSLQFSGSEANVYAGTTVLQGGVLLLDKSLANAAIPGDLVIGDGVGGSDADVVRLRRSTQVANGAAVTLTGSGLLDLDGHGEAFDRLTGSGRVYLGGGYLNLGARDGSSTFDGVIGGAGGRLTKLGTGTLTLGGDNAYTGTTLIEDGKLVVQGVQPASAVSVDPGATLAGTGIVGPIISSGTVAPGVSPGRLTSGNVDLRSGATFAVELNGPSPGSGHDQLNAAGTVALNSATLSATLDAVAAEGDTFTILANDGTDSVTGQFLGLAEGAEFSAGPARLAISYTGGTGNDVVLTVVGTALESVRTEVGTGNGDGKVDPDECNLLYVVLTNTTASTLTGIETVLSTTHSQVLIHQAASAYPNILAAGAAMNRTPFQLSTLPTLDCRAAVDLELMVTTATHGSFLVQFSLKPGCDPGTGPCLPCPDQSVAGVLASSDATLSEMLTRDGNASVCGKPKTCPGTQTVTMPVHYDAYGFQNGASNACVRVQLRARGPLYSAAYAPQFDPRDLCRNYVADAGTTGNATFEFDAAAGQVYVIVVAETGVLALDKDYLLTVSGGSCDPWLEIHPAQGENVVLSWPTFAPAHQLESRGSLDPEATIRWFPQGPLPVVHQGQYMTTNTTSAIPMRFYRLHSPAK